MHDNFIIDTCHVNLKSSILNSKNNLQFNFNAIKICYKFHDMEFHMKEYGYPFFIFDDEKYTIEDVVKMYNELK